MTEVQSAVLKAALSPIFTLSQSGKTEAFFKEQKGQKEKPSQK